MTTHYYLLKLFKYNTCHDVPNLLKIISRKENLALGDVGNQANDNDKGNKNNLLFYDKRGRYICFSFTPRPDYELDKAKPIFNLKSSLEHFLEPDGAVSRSELDLIFKENGVYHELLSFDLSSKIPNYPEEKSMKAEKQLEIFKRILGIFSKESNNYITNEFDLDELLIDSLRRKGLL